MNVYLISNHMKYTYFLIGWLDFDALSSASEVETSFGDEGFGLGTKKALSSELSDVAEAWWCWEEFDWAAGEALNLSLLCSAACCCCLLKNVKLSSYDVLIIFDPEFEPLSLSPEIQDNISLFEKKYFLR